MRERPILFNGEMVRAILEGRKTQTRRPVVPQPPDWVTEHEDIWPWVHFKGLDPLHGPAMWTKRCPFEVGDRLWVRETWAVAPLAVHYRADNGFKSYPDEPRLYDYESTQGWRPSIHMPRWACRLVLEVTGRRVERLQDITEQDAEAEGCPLEPTAPHPLMWFRDLWDSLYLKRGYGYDANGWVWVGEFRRVE